MPLKQPPVFPLGGLSEFLPWRPVSKNGQPTKRCQAMMTIQSGLPRSMSSRTQILVSGLGVSLAIVAVIVGLDATVATARSRLEPSVQIVNRMQKGDRLPPLSNSHLNAVSQRLKINAPRTPTLDSKLADGCEPIVSFLAHSELARIAGRCVS